MLDDDQLFDDSADQVVDLGNELIDQHPDGDLWAVADGLIAGAVHFWLYAHQPENSVDETEYESYNTATRRLQELMKLVQQSATESEYLHSPDDSDVGRA